MGFEDDVVVEFAVAQLEDAQNNTLKKLDPRQMQINLTGFMERKAAPFCRDLWSHLLSAQQSVIGVPNQFIEDKKKQMEEKKNEAEKLQKELQRRKQDLEALAKPGLQHLSGRSGRADLERNREARNSHYESRRDGREDRHRSRSRRRGRSRSRSAQRISSEEESSDDEPVAPRKIEEVWKPPDPEEAARAKAKKEQKK